MESTKLFDDRIKTKVVTTYEQQRDALLVRAVAYAGDGNAPIHVLTDGNDYQATHFIAYIGDEPIGSARVRWFNNFAKFERTCFVPKHRNARSIYTTSNSVFSHIARKGYERVFTYAEPKYAKIWVRLLGFAQTEKIPLELNMSDLPYVELVKHLGKTNDAITTESEGKFLERIEGYWDSPVSYEK